MIVHITPPSKKHNTTQSHAYFPERQAEVIGPGTPLMITLVNRCMNTRRYAYNTPTHIRSLNYFREYSIIHSLYVAKLNENNNNIKKKKMANVMHNARPTSDFNL